MIKILYVIAALLLLTVIVVAHELGHYLVGRLCGIGVVEFSVGFGPKLAGFKRKGIQYSLRAIPLGGFCKFVGEDSDNLAPGSINEAKPWKRFLTVSAGPVMNFIFAFIVCVILLLNYAYSDLLPKLEATVEGMPASEQGMIAGDIIKGINGKDVAYDTSGVQTISEEISNTSQGETVSIIVDRNGEEIIFDVEPKAEEGSDGPMIGIQFSLKRNSFTDALRGAVRMTKDSSTIMVDALRKLITRGEGINEMSGPVGIVSTISDYINEGMYMILYFMFIISLNLGIMNLLPLPALDGGRLIFIIIEWIRGKKVPPEKEGLVHLAGFALLIMLMVFVTYKDIARIITG